MESIKKKKKKSSKKSSKASNIIDINMVSESQSKSKKEVIDELTKKMAVLSIELRRIAAALKTANDILKQVAQMEDVEGDISLDDDIDYDNDEEHVHGGDTYKVGETVQLCDSKKKKWSRTTGKIVSFCEQMAKIKTNGGVNARRKYGNFRKVEY